MTEFFRFTIELKAQIHDAPRGVGQGEVFERVKRLAQRITQDKQMRTDVYKITFLDLLLADGYSDVIHQKMALKKEKDIILPASTGLESQDATFFKELFSESLQENLGETKDNALNLLFSQFGNPVIIDVRFECTRTGKEDQEKENL